MKIITGSARGRNLKSVTGEETRPTSNVVKQAIFNIIQFDIAGRRVLDLFAGTGQLGLEALSRGAEKAVFVDHSPEAVEVIRDNVRSLNMGDKALVVKNDYKAFLRTVKPNSFDLILLDPPYRDKFLEKILGYIDQGDMLSEGGIAVCELKSGERMPEETGHLTLTHLRKYGGTTLALYKKQTAAPAEQEPQA